MARTDHDDDAASAPSSPVLPSMPSQFAVPGGPPLDSTQLLSIFRTLPVFQKVRPSHHASPSC